MLYIYVIYIYVLHILYIRYMLYVSKPPPTSHLLIFGWVGHVLGDVLHRVAHGLWWVLLMLTTEARRIGRGMVAVAEGLLPATWARNDTMPWTTSM